MASGNATLTTWLEATTYALPIDINTTMDNLTTLAPTMSPDFYIYSRWAKAINTYIAPVICAFGIVCNALNLIVLSQHQLKESPYTYLTGLAFTDLCALLLSIIYYVFSSTKPYNYYWRFYEAYIFVPFANICTNSSVWLVVLLTIERFLFVRHPLWAKATCNRASAKLKIAVLFVIIVIINIPKFLVFHVDTETHPLGPILGMTEFRTGDHYHIITWFNAVTIQFIPLFVLICANIYLLFAVKRARTEREVLHLRNNKEAAWQREQIRLTITLISIVTLFIICIIPSAFADFPIAFALFGGGYTRREFRDKAFYRIFGYMSNVLVLVNLSLNFVLYCAFNNKFRRVMRMTLLRCCFRRKMLRCCFRRKPFLLLVNFKSSSITRTNSCQTNSISMATKVSNMSPDILVKPDKYDPTLNHSTVSTTLVDTDTTEVTNDRHDDDKHM